MSHRWAATPFLARQACTLKSLTEPLGVVVNSLAASLSDKLKHWGLCASALML